MWEGVGVCSYLLVSFWFTRIAANQSSMSAFLTNRVGDCFLTIGMFTVLWSFGKNKMLKNSEKKQYLNISYRQERKYSSHRPTNNLDPYFVTGFSDGESCFSVWIGKSSKEDGWRVLCRFVITLHLKDLDLLYNINNFFGVGKVYMSTKDSCTFTVQSIKDLDIITDHFNKYPLITQKSIDFLLFKQVCELVKCRNHLTKEGLKEILSIKASMNRGLTEKFQRIFPDLIPTSRPIVVNQEIKDPNWLSGFVAGEGCFLIDTLNSKSNKVGKQVVLKFQVTQNVRDINLLKSLNSYLVSGKYYQGANRDRGDFRIQKFSDNINVVIPFFKNYPIHGVKAKDFTDYCKIADLILNKAHLTAPGLEEIVRIKSGMNRGRDSSLNIDNKEGISCLVSDEGLPISDSGSNLLLKLSRDCKSSVAYSLYNKNILIRSGAFGRATAQRSAGSTSLSYPKVKGCRSYLQLTRYCYSQVRSFSLNTYLAGLIEGKGEIVIHDSYSKTKVYRPKFIIALPIRDKLLVEKFSIGLKVGKVISKPSAGHVLLEISAKKEVLMIINLINGHMRTPKIEALHKAIHWINEKDNSFIPYLGIDTSSLDSNSWLAGFTDADGHFSIAVYDRKKGTSVQTFFRIEVKQNYSRDVSVDPGGASYFSIMTKIAEFFTVNLYTRTRYVDDKVYYAFIIISHNWRSHDIVRNYFNHFPLYSSKYLAYKDWCRIQDLHKGISLSKEGLKEIKAIKKQFKSKRKAYDLLHLDSLTI